MKGRQVLAAVMVAAALALSGCGFLITPEGTPGPSVAPTGGAPPATPLASPVEESYVPPPATAAPTVTPTPIFYEVQSGDTLGGIALAYGVSVQALQVANGIDNPLLLQPGQVLIIPTGDEAAGLSPGLLLPTPTPMTFVIRGVSFYETPVGSLWCLGEVFNGTAITLTNVQVQVTLYDAAGVPLVSGDAFAAADLVPPEGRAPFSLLFSSPPPGFVSHSALPLRGEPAGELVANYLSIAVEGVSGAPSGPQFRVSGTVRNGDPVRTATEVTVVATTYDAEGRVSGYRQQRLEVGEGLAPGATIPFELLFSVYGGEPADFSVIAFGRTT